jgi:hypothetical protein
LINETSPIKEEHSTDGSDHISFDGGLVAAAAISTPLTKQGRRRKADQTQQEYPQGLHPLKSSWDFFKYITPMRNLIRDFHQPSPFVALTPAIHQYQQVTQSSDTPDSESRVSTPTEDLHKRLLSISLHERPPTIKETSPIKEPAYLDETPPVVTSGDLVPFEQFLQRCKPSNLRKIGEATFSEVYGFDVSLDVLKAVFGWEKDIGSPIRIAMKVIPYGDDASVTINGESQSKQGDIDQEVSITTFLSGVPGFITCYGYV